MAASSPPPPPPPPSISNEKAVLRRALQRRRRALPPQAIEAAGAAVVARIAAAPWFERARTIGIYAAARGEVPLGGLLPHGAERCFAYPRVDPSSRVLTFWALETGVDLEVGPMEIPIPPRHGVRQIALSDLDLILVPGVAFDREGQRLGQGGGYYDTTLPRTSAHRVGVAHDWQVLETLPHEAHDAPLHQIVTPSGILRVPGKAAN